MCLLARHPAQTKPDAEDFVVNHGKPESVEAKETRNPFGIVGRRVGIVGKDPRELVTQTSWIFADLNFTSEAFSEGQSRLVHVLYGHVERLQFMSP